MIISDKFVFIHNPHCGGSSIRTMLKKTHKDSIFYKLERWHEPVDSLNQNNCNKFKFGFIRNPWFWYASFYEHQQPNGQFLKLFLDGRKNEFSRFLTNMLSRKFIKKYLDRKFHPVGNPYTKKRLYKFRYINSLDIGFFTYRYIYMFFNNYDNIFYKNKKYIYNNHDKLLFLDYVGKTESLIEDLSKAFKNNNIRFNDNILNKWQKTPKENGRRKKPYCNYYNDNDLIELVKVKDKLIIDKYGYKF